MMDKKRFLQLLILVLALVTAGPDPVMAAKILNGTLTCNGTQTQVSGSWKKKKKKYYFAASDAAVKTGWLNIDSKVYYLTKSGYRVTGVKKIDGKYYYFKSNGVRKTGLISVKGSTFYFDPAQDGVRTGAGTIEINGETWTFNQEGKALKNAFDDNGVFHDAKGYPIQKATIKHLLQVALQPVGTTLYVWGGGWNLKDTGDGIESTTIGVSSRWEAFFSRQNSSYDYRTTRFQVHDGLDCSGFVGWTLYNTFNTQSGHGGYVMLAQTMARTFSEWGWGKYQKAGRMKHRAGDIMSYSGGHVYIVIGQCSDGSVVLVHSSPKGVMINGTVSRSGKKNSKAWNLAKKYMKQYYPTWYRRYPDVSRGSAYLSRYAKMSWTIGGMKSVMSDPEGYCSMSPEAILKDLFGS